VVRIREELEFVAVEAVAAVGADMQDRISHGDDAYSEDVAAGGGEWRIDLASLLNGRHERFLGQSFICLYVQNSSAGSFIPQGIASRSRKRTSSGTIPPKHAKGISCILVLARLQQCRFCKARSRSAPRAGAAAEGFGKIFR
jgi:hypothetical protein